MGRRGVLASGHYLAARAGQRMFDRGGNASDACVTSGFALNLLEPEEPVSVDYHGLTVYKCPPWTQGPVFLQQLRLLEGFDLKKLGHNSASYIHTVIESAKLAFADRERCYGDPRFVDVPLKKLLSREYADERRKLIDPRKASLEMRPGEGPKTPPEKQEVPAAHEEQIGYVTGE